MHSLQRIFRCFSTIPKTKTGYTSVHSTLSSMQNVTVQFQKYSVIQGHPSSVQISCCQITTQRERSFNIGFRGRRRHEIQCQLRQSLVAGLAIQPELCLKWSSVLELCCVTLEFRVSIGFVYKSLQRRAYTDSGIISAGTYIINQLTY